MARKPRHTPPTDGQLIAGLIVTAAIAGATMWAVDAALTHIAKAVKASK